MTTEQIIVFTRYPEPGKTKTRLIPALGAEGAAELQQQMTEHTLRQIRQIERPSLSVNVRYTGGNLALMRSWLGSSWHYTPQGEGDLGDRLERAFAAAFDAGIDWAIAIGIDCPGLDARRLTQALQGLRSHDIVLGPAADGGYYLIGMRQFRPELFQTIAWSTAVVFQQTLEVVQRSQQSVLILDELADVDRPEDLHIWFEAMPATPTQPTLSVIIPVLNEEHTIAQVVAHALSEPGVEVIVVDGGSGDRTVEMATAAGARVLSTLPGRSQQMNAGAAAATGETLLFLHADTRLPPGFTTYVHQALAQPKVIAGAFELRIDGRTPGLNLIEWGVKWRSRLCQLPYGDQAIFLRSSTFHQIGGFADLPIMEDFDLVRRLKMLGRVAIAPAAVITSGRRWEKLGVVRTTLVNQGVIAAYLLGISPRRIARWYRGDRP